MYRRQFLKMLGWGAATLAGSECKVFDEYVSGIINEYNNIIGYLKISSKTGYNVKEAFNSLLKIISN